MPNGKNCIREKAGILPTIGGITIGEELNDKGRSRFTCCYL
jgi:hypothetical protein